VGEVAEIGAGIQHSVVANYLENLIASIVYEYCQLNLLHQHLALLASVTLLYTACQASQQARFAPEGERSLLR